MGDVTSMLLKHTTTLVCWVILPVVVIRDIPLDILSLSMSVCSVVSTIAAVVDYYSRLLAASSYH